jgi:hypothetical protein
MMLQMNVRFDHRDLTIDHPNHDDILAKKVAHVNVKHEQQMLIM